MRSSLASALMLGTLSCLSGHHALAQTPVCQSTFEPKLQQQFQEAIAAQKKASGAEPKPIYGCDDRKNFYDSGVTDNQRKAAQATAILVKSDQLKSKDQGAHWDLPSNGAHFCSPREVIEANNRNPQIAMTPERFWQEPAPGFCSGEAGGRASRRPASPGPVTRRLISGL